MARKKRDRVVKHDSNFTHDDFLTGLSDRIADENTLDAIAIILRRDEDDNDKAELECLVNSIPLDDEMLTRLAEHVAEILMTKTGCMHRLKPNMTTNSLSIPALKREAFIDAYTGTVRNYLDVLPEMLARALDEILDKPIGDEVLAKLPDTKPTNDIKPRKKHRDVEIVNHDKPNDKPDDDDFDDGDSPLLQYLKNNCK